MLKKESNSDSVDVVGPSICSFQKVLKMKEIIVIFLNLILIFYVGTPEGTVFEFIVMISNYEDDIIDGPIDT